MTRWSITRVSFPAAALMLTICGLFTCASPVRAEVRLHASTATVFTLSFKVNRAPSDEVLQTADQFQPDEVAFGSLQSLQNILLPQLARLSQLLPPVPFHRSLSADKARRHEYIGPTTLPLNPLVWSFPEHSLSLVSETYSTLPQITAIGDRLTAEYAATALGGNLAGWDITFGLSADPALDTRAYAVALSRQLADSIPHSSGFSSRLTPLALAAKAIDALPLSEASTTAVASQSQAATELLQPTQEGEAARRWVMPPDIAAEFRGGGRLVNSSHTSENAQPKLIRAVNSTNSGNGKSEFKR